MPVEPPPPPTAPPRRRRWGRLTLGGLLLGPALLALSTPWLVESPLGRTLVSAALRRQGVELDWERLTLSVRKARVELTGLEVAAGESSASAARLALDWDWGAARQGITHLRTLTLDDVVVRLAPDAPAAGTPAALPPRWSGLLEPLAALPPLHLDAVTVRRLAVHHPTGSVAGLGLEGALHVGRGVAPAGFLALTGGSASWRREGSARRLGLDAAARASLDGDAVRLQVHATLIEGFEGLPLREGPLLDLEATARVEPASRRAVVRLERAALLGTAARSTAALSLRDGEALPVVEAAEVSADLAALLPLAKTFEPTLTLTEGRLDLGARPDGSATPALEGALQLRGLTHAAGALAAAAGTVRVWPSVRRAEVTLTAEHLEAARDGRRLGALALGLDASAALTDRRGAVSLALRLDGLQLDDGDRRHGVRSLALRARSDDVSPEGPFPLSAAVEGELSGFSAPGVRLSSAGLGGRVELASATGGALHLELPVTGLDAPPVSLEAGRLAVDVPRFSLEGAPAAPPSADFRVRAQGTALRAALDEGSVTLPRAELSATGALAREALETLTGTITSAPLGLARGTQRLTLAGAALAFTASNLSAAAGQAQVDGQLLGVELHASVTRTKGGRLGVTGRARAPTPATLLPLLAPHLPDGVSVEPSKGPLTLDVRLDHGAGVSAGDAHLRLEQPSGEVAKRALGAAAIDVRLGYRAGGGAQHLSGTATVEAPRVGAETLAGPLTVALDGSRDAPRGRLELMARATVAEAKALSVRLDLARQRSGVVGHRLSLDAGNLGRLTPLVRAWRGDDPELDLSALGAHLEADGSTTGLLDETLSVDPDWKAHVDSGQHVSLSLTDVVHHTEGETVRVPRLDFVLDAGVHHGAVHVESSIEAPKVDVDLGRHHATVLGPHLRLVADSDDLPTQARLRLHLTGAIDALTQNLWRPWEPGAVTLDAQARLDRLSAFSIDRFLLESPEGGTRLTLTKRLRLADVGTSSGEDEAVFVTGGQRFVLDGALRQDLGRLDGDPSAFRGSGVVTMPFLVDSADRQLFRVRGRLELDRATAVFPAAGLEVHEASGAATLEEALALDPVDGLVLVPGGDERAFARARYQDVQPFLASDALLTAARLRVGDVELAPVVASLEVRRNRFSLNKLKARRGEAQLSGQVFFDYQPGNRVLTFRGAITGLARAGAAVPLDANAALSLSLDRFEVDGRVQVVRTSREHVVDLLDVLDPYQQVAALNRLRTALEWGYPRQLRLDFHDGLLAVDVELGGLAALFDLGVMRGIALGPFVTRYLVPRLSPKGPP